LVCSQRTKYKKIAEPKTLRREERLQAINMRTDSPDLQNKDASGFASIAGNNNIVTIGTN